MEINTAGGIPYGAVIAAPQSRRKLRSPIHDFQLRHRPYQLQPFLVAPVLPGETMKNASVNYQAYTDPIKNPLLGWWLEHYLFYVPFRAMPFEDELTAMVLDPAFGELDAAADSAASVPFYHKHSADPSWAALATQAVVEEFFRNEGEAWNTGTTSLGGVPQVGLMNSRWTESITLDSLTGEPDTLPGQFDQDGQLDALMGAGAATLFQDAYDQYQALVAAKMVAEGVTYEDYLKSYGVRMPKAPSERKPELLRYSKDWQYPKRAVDPTDGSIAASVGWRDAFRADKDRRFTEPGVILGLTCATPKIYMSSQVQPVIDSMKTALDWLPAVLRNEAFTSLKKFTSNGVDTGNGPLGFTPGSDYWVDIRDLFVGGDQFVNFALTETDAGLMAVPDSTLQRRFVTSSEVDALFTSGAANLVRQDGRCRFAILSNVEDMTP